MSEVTTGFFSNKDSPLEKRIARVLEILAYVGVVITVALMFLTVAHSLGRYGFNNPIPGLKELSTFMMIGLSFLAIPNTTVLKGHIIVGLLVDRLPERKQAIFDSFNYTVCIIAAVFALWFAAKEAIHMMQINSVTQILAIPQYPFMAFIAVGWGLLALSLSLHLVHFVIRAVHK